MKKKLISGLLSAVLTIGLLGAGLPAATSVSYGATFSDIDEHWAKPYILEAADKGIVTGYPDGTFLPDKPVTRAEFTKMVNNALGNETTATVDFSDVPAIEWYYNEVSKALAAGYVGGYDDGTFLPNNNITRQEAAVMISRIVPVAGYSAVLSGYADYANISDWAQSSLSRVVGKKYLGAYDDGLLHPLDNLTRAQAAKILNDIVSKETIVKSAVTVKDAGTKLADKIYSNGLTINKNVGEGMVVLDNCVVLGSMFVQGGGSDDVIIEDSRIASMHVSKHDSEVGILAKGDTRIIDTVVWRHAVLHTQDLGGGLFGTGYDLINVYADGTVTLDGNYPKVKVSGANACVNFDAGTLKTLEIAEAGKNCEVNLGQYATLTTADVNAVTAFKGRGEVKTLNANISGITYEVKPATVNVKDGVTAPKFVINAALTNLNVVGSISSTPSYFKADTLEYSVQMPSGTSEAAISATAAAGATILYSNNGSTWSTDTNTFPVAAGTAKQVFIKVMESGKYDTIYTLTITVAPAAAQ